MILSRLLAHSAIAPLKAPRNLRSSLRVSLRVCIVVSFPEGELGKLGADCSEATSRAVVFEFNLRLAWCSCLCVCGGI